MNSLDLCRPLLLALVVTIGAQAQTPTLPLNKDLYPRLRGDGVTCRNLKPDVIEFLAAHHCNVLRTGISVDDNSLNKPTAQQIAPTADDPLLPYKENLAKLDAILPLCHKYGIQVIVCAGDVYGRHVDVFWKNTQEGSAARAQIPLFWKAMSARYKDDNAVVGYDIKNEPVYSDDDAAGWWDDTYAKSVAYIRANDQKAWIVAEGGPSALAWSFSTMRYQPDSRTIYSFHTYMPHGYTHQGVRFLQHRSPVDSRGKWTYPGMAPRIEGAATEEYWDKAAVEKTMNSVVAFQARHPDARIFVGEFGVIRWAKGGDQLLKDDLDIFERHGWDWAFVCIGDWNGWDPTYPPNASGTIHNRPLTNGIVETESYKTIVAGWALNLAPPPTTPPAITNAATNTSTKQ